MRDRLSKAAFLKPLTAVALPGLLTGCQRAVLNPAGDVALQQRDLIYISTGLMLLIIVPVMLLIVVFAWRYRAENREATYDPDFHHSTSLELVIWSVPLLIIIALGAVTWSSTHLLDPFRRLDRISAVQPVDRAQPPLTVQVVAMDWKWLFIYPEQGVASVNEVVLPVNREVRFDITSTNMMNTFYAPTLAGMIYAMPGMKSQLHAVLNRPGDYEGFSANYSGAGFSDMRFKLTGTDQAGFDRWIAAARQQPRRLETADYLALEKPSEKVAPQAFAAVAPGLFDKVVGRCVKPGVPCMHEVMAADRRMDAGGKGLVPPAHNSMPQHGKPEGALMKAPEEISPGLNVTKPRAPGAPGSTQPGSPRNRDVS